MNVTQQSVRLQNGTEIQEYTLKNGGLSVNVLNLGGVIRSLWVPDRNGRAEDVVLGYADLEGYLRNEAFFGCVIGRYANRIAQSRFTINQKAYLLVPNEGKNSLHGGAGGFHRQLWDGRVTQNALVLRRTSPDGEEGFPGNLEVTVAYSLHSDRSLRIRYLAESDADTYVNLTNHTFFNLNGHASGDADGHILKIYADHYTPADRNGIPTGEILSVKNSPFDFRRAKPIGRDIGADHEQLANAGGYDRNFVLRANGYGIAAEAYSPQSGRKLTVHTTMPGLQLYTGNKLNGEAGKGGARYQKRQGFCLETQFFPDTPNTPHFPSCLLRKGAMYDHTTVYRFTCGE